MNKNRGFTLVEVLGIIVILGFIVLLTIPNMTKQIQNEETQQKNVLKEKIENAAKLYAAKYYSSQIANGDNFKITIEDLENDGLLILKPGQCNAEKNIDIYNYGFEFDKVKTCYN